MNPFPRQNGTHCPACHRNALEWRFIQLPGGSCDHIAICSQCSYVPKILGYLHQRQAKPQLQRPRRRGAA